MKNEWSTDKKNLPACSLCGDASYLIEIDAVLDAKIMAITRDIKDIEWLGYLKGHQSGNVFRADDLHVPKQTVSAGSVDVDEPLAGDNVLGTVHLHPGTSKFLSSTDEDYIASNHSIALSVNNNGDYTAVVKHNLPCGHYTLLPTTVKVLFQPRFDLAKFVAGVKGNITRKVWQATGVVIHQSTIYPGTGFFCAVCRDVKPYTEKVVHASGLWTCKDCASYCTSLDIDPANFWDMLKVD